jgi:hypothetical protein
MKTSAKFPSCFTLLFVTLVPLELLAVASLRQADS